MCVLLLLLLLLVYTRFSLPYIDPATTHLGREIYISIYLLM